MTRFIHLSIIFLLPVLFSCSSPSSLPEEKSAAAVNTGQTPNRIEPKDDAILTKSPLLVADVINFVVENSPSLKASQAKWNAAKTRAVQMSTPEDPSVSVYRMKEMEATKTGLVLEQKFTSSGKLDVQGKVAEQEAKIAQQEFIIQRFNLIAQAKSAYYDLFWANQVVRINQEVKELISNTEKIAELQYATGTGNQQDVLQAQIELARINNEITTLERLKETAMASLNKILNRSASAPLGVPSEITIKPLASTLEQLTERAMEHNPELKAAGLEIDKNKRFIDLANKQFYSDFMVSAEYDRYSYRPGGLPGKNGWAAGIGINIPLWQEKYKAAVREAEAQTRASRESQQSAKNNTEFAVKDISVRIVNAWKVLELYQNNLIPQAEQLLIVSQTSYQTGKTGFIDVLNGNRLILDLKLGFYQAQVDYKKALAELEAVCAFSIEE